MHSTKVLIVMPGLLLALLLPAQMEVEAFGNEYVHIKVLVPKEQANTEQAPPHKVIHHFHHHGPHQRSRGRAPPKPKPSPLLESVILSDLDKPLHMSEHADYLNHAKELAEHLSESYAKKPPPPKKKVNTYTIIEEKHRPNSYEPEHGVDTYRVIDAQPQQHHHHHQHNQHNDEDDDDTGYHYIPPARQHRHKGYSTTSSYHGYAEPAPVEEPLDVDQGYSYTPPAKSARAPAHTLVAPEESLLDSPYQYDYGSSSGGNSNGFRPSPQLTNQPDNYEDEIDAYAAPAPVRHQRLGPVDWSRRSKSSSRSGSGYNSASANTYNGVDSYNVGHVQGLGSAGYQYPGPYL